MRNGDFQLLDFSGLIEIVPRMDRLITNMNLFTEHYGRYTFTKVERVDDGVAELAARQRGGERNHLLSEKVKQVNLNIPFFPLDRSLDTADIQNFREYGTDSAPKTVEQAVTRYMRTLRNSHNNLKEKAMFQTVMGKSWAPEDPNCQYDFYQVWGVTQQTANVDFTKLAIDPIEVIEAEARAHIIENAGNDGDNYEIIVLASRKWFSALIAHPQVTGAYSQYPSTQEMLRRRLGGNSNNRIFEHKNILFIEDISGNIPAGDAYIMPRGIEKMFNIHYAPSDTLRGANQVAQEIYIWFKESAYLREAKIETETSFLTTNTRPELVVKSTGTFA
jgi:hypothetical protein